MLLDKIFALIATLAPAPPPEPPPVVTEPAQVDGCGDEWDDTEDHDDGADNCEEF